MDLYIVIIFLFIMAPIATFIHEFGHAIGARMRGADNVNLSLGTGNKCIHFNLNNIHITICSLYFLGGLVWSNRSTPYSNSELVLIALSGPISNGMVALVSFIPFYFIPNSYLSVFILFNLWLCIMNLIPFKIKQKKSDGYTIWQVLFEK
ncbi:M50 family metallopeptidase [Oceanobacillus halotolerans]|uniref:M50 family metallopeptidase n=1 Tax=Oceanobacillus halotolerans TaxID=2663380 RepID=UPI0013DD30A8|nr:M50 family metallopeptidase [Oceanobacillus halotolerans]